MLIIGIDPGPVESGICLLQSDGKKVATDPAIVFAHKAKNEEVRSILICHIKFGLEVAIEGMVYQGRGFGQSSIETCYFIGELREALRKLGVNVTLYSRREYGQWTTGGAASLNDTTIRAALESTYGPFAKKTDPLYSLRGASDKRSAFAIAKYHEFKLFGSEKVTV